VSETVTVTCEQPDGTTTKLLAQRGANLRQLLTDNGLNVYQNIARITNCKGKQFCGTCIVDTGEGSELKLNRKSLDEVSKLGDNPDRYRLSCVTFMYDDLHVKTFPNIGADTINMWTPLCAALYA